VSLVPQAVGAAVKILALFVFGAWFALTASLLFNLLIAVLS
jgi:hypothetical protein